MTRLSLEQIAKKLHSLRAKGSIGVDHYLATPRYVEALCFVQAMSQLPGGIEKFTKTFIDASEEWYSTLPGRGGDLEENLLMRFDSFETALCKWCIDGEPYDVGESYSPSFERRFPGVLEALCKFMDAYAEDVLKQTADTSLRRKVFMELDFARTSTPPIPMVPVADTRHGKTTAVQTYCRAWPGRARLVTIPESNWEWEFYAAYAEAFGVEVSRQVGSRVLKDRVQFTLRHTGMCCIHDEAHWLLPINYKKNTPPQRMNWVRAQVIDRHLPCAFFCTPQSQEETLARYVERTHYNMEQWLGRMPKPVLISDKPTYDDLMAVARVRFSDFPQAALDELCDAAESTIDGAGSRESGEGGFKIVELAGARARFLASQHGGRVTVADVRQAGDWAGVPLSEAKSPTAPSMDDFSRSARGAPGRRGHAAVSPPRLRSTPAIVGAEAPEHRA